MRIGWQLLANTMQLLIAAAAIIAYGMSSALAHSGHHDHPVIYATTCVNAYVVKRLTNGAADIRAVDDPTAHTDRQAIDFHLIEDLQEADLIVRSSLQDEAWLDYISLPRSRVVDISQGLEMDALKSHDAIVHSHGPEGAHSHSKPAIAPWLDLTILLKQIKNIEDALHQKLPHTPAIAKNSQALQQDIAALHEEMTALGKSARDVHFFAPYAAYDYLARRYGLSIMSLGWRQDGAPTDAQWQVITKKRRVGERVFMLCSRPPSAAIARRLSAQDIGVIMFNSLDADCLDADVAAVIKQNITAMRKALSLR